MDEFLSSAALNPGSVGPTLPPMQPFQIPTGPTGSTGATGATGNTEPYWQYRTTWHCFAHI
ncbi:MULTISPECIES: exosporium leader peptide-containing protein [Bacillus]|uniref:exosporium leader peptide-containing protein n=1 Tax=unclassified Bacillus (in: firmicutes) TaxID=185979 RepID=UPI002F3550BE